MLYNLDFSQNDIIVMPFTEATWSNVQRGSTVGVFVSFA